MHRSGLSTPCRSALLQSNLFEYGNDVFAKLGGILAHRKVPDLFHDDRLRPGIALAVHRVSSGVHEKSYSPVECDKKTRGLFLIVLTTLLLCRTIKLRGVALFATVPLERLVR